MGWALSLARWAAASPAPGARGRGDGRVGVDRAARLPFPPHTVAGVRLTYFRELMEGEFGAVRAAAVARDHVFSELGGLTVDQALEQGVDPREAWLAVCRAYDVPPARR